MMIGKPSDAAAVPPSPRTGAVSTSRVPPAATGTGGEKSVAQTDADSVQLSEAGRTLVAPQPTATEFREDKVAAVRKAIEDGQYEIQARKIADRMIQEASELLESLASSK